jgi:hypothetical protein
VILATRETAFPDGAPFLLTIPNAEDNVERAADAIAAFAAEWRGRRVPRESIAAIDVDVVEPQRIELVRREVRPRRMASEDRGRILSRAASSEPADSARRNN